MILIIDDMPIFREPISACLKLAGYETMCASDGREGLAMALKNVPELILLDMAMPGLDGLQVLQRLRREPKTASTPVVMLSAVADRDRIVLAIHYGAQEYLLKSRFTTKDLLARIKKHLLKSPAGDIAFAPHGTAAEQDTNVNQNENNAGTSAKLPPQASHKPVNPKVTGKNCIRRIQTATSGKALSGVVTQVIATAASPRGDSADLSKLICSDPVLTARVLGAANSAAYATNGGICTTVDEAVRKIGFSGIRNITAAVGIFDFLSTTTANGFNPIQYWQHSVAVAQLCERLISADTENDGSSGHAYICGLCHDLGEMLVRGEFDQEYRQMLETQRSTGRPRKEIHAEILGLSHSGLVSEALRAIGLPKSIGEPIQNFHERKTLRDKVGPIPGILRIMDRYANGLLLGAAPESPIEAFEGAFVSSLLGSDRFSAIDADSFCSQVRNLTITLAGLGRNEAAQLLAPMYSKAPTKRVWLARDPQLSDCDPVHAAISQMAAVTLYSSLPTADDSSAYDYLVVIAANPAIKEFTEDAITKSISAKGGPRPLLWIVSDAQGVQPGKTVCPIQMPIQLGVLATFLGQA
jgi:HD-like signal output (HDOD) protein/CheY-like chemotaxis protein